MARQRSPRVIEVKAALVERLESDFAHPGGRFFSTRAVAQRFAASYQTAHRLLRLRPEYYPIVWECRAAIEAAAEQRSFALCLNDHPPIGLSGS